MQGTILDYATSYLDGVLVALNWMYGIRAYSFDLGSFTTAQRTAHGVILDSAFFLYERLLEGESERSSEGWHVFEKRGEAQRLELIADAVGSQDSHNGGASKSAMGMSGLPKY